MSDVASNEKHESAVPVTPQATVLEAEVTAEAEVAAKTSLPPPPSTATEAEAAAGTTTVEQVAIDFEAAGDAANDSNASKSTEVATPQKDNKKTPVKRTPSKRMSFIERAQKESEELVKTMGGSLELEGGRRTRSSTRGTPTSVAAATTPPPAKKARNSPANATNTTPSRARGRGRKIDTAIETAEDEMKKPDEESDKSIDKNDVSGKDLDSSSSVEIVKNATEQKNNRNNNASEKSASATEDKVDAVLNSVPEEKQNNVDHATEEKVEKSEATPATSGTPMETDEQTEPKPVTTKARIHAEKVDKEVTSKVSDVPAPAVAKIPKEVAKTAVATVASAAPTVQKEPTPEPMEVDSSTKDDVPVVESAPITVAEKANTNNSATIVTVNAQSEPATANKTLSDDAEQPSEVTPTLPITENSNAVAEKTNAVENDTKRGASETENEHKVTANAEAKSEVPVVAETKEVTNTNETVSKPENDFCEPKIVSPSINANNESTTTTPQYCN